MIVFPFVEPNDAANADRSPRVSQPN